MRFSFAAIYGRITFPKLILPSATIIVAVTCLASAFSILLLPSCTERMEGKPDIPALLDAIECNRRDISEPMQRAVDTEAKDRVNYSPVRFEVVPVVMRVPGKGYHGSTKGSYILILEEYSSVEAAEKRVAEYRIPGYPERIKEPDTDEANSKSSVRCWGIADGKTAYLLTTHAAMFSALEKLTHDLERKLTAHIKK